MMNTLINLENLKEIYLISNTASFLYSEFVKDENLIDFKNSLSQKELISQFEIIIKKEIDKLDDLVLSYVIFISILLNDNEETSDFLNTIGNLNFEWFPELRSIYLSRLRPFNINRFEVSDFVTTSSNKVTNSNDSEINEQIIEYI